MCLCSDPVPLIIILTRHVCFTLITSPKCTYPFPGTTIVIHRRVYFSWCWKPGHYNTFGAAPVTGEVGHLRKWCTWTYGAPQYTSANGALGHLVHNILSVEESELALHSYASLNSICLQFFFFFRQQVKSTERRIGELVLIKQCTRKLVTCIFNTRIEWTRKWMTCI